MKRMNLAGLSKKSANEQPAVVPPVNTPPTKLTKADRDFCLRALAILEYYESDSNATYSKEDGTHLYKRNLQELAQAVTPLKPYIGSPQYQELITAGPSAANSFKDTLKQYITSTTAGSGWTQTHLEERIKDWVEAEYVSLTRCLGEHP